MPELAHPVYTRTFAIDEIDELAGQLLSSAHARVWLFEGEMGAGKTTLIKALCRQLGVKSHMSSPTFGIINEYEGQNGTLVHMDLYRITREQDLLERGVVDYLSSGQYCFVEWPDRLGNWKPESYTRARLTWQTENTRTIEIETYG